MDREMEAMTQKKSNKPFTTVKSNYYFHLHNNITALATYPYSGCDM